VTPTVITLTTKRLRMRVGKTFKTEGGAVVSFQQEASHGVFVDLRWGHASAHCALQKQNCLPISMHYGLL